MLSCPQWWALCHLSSIRFNHPYLFADLDFLVMSDPSQHTATASGWPAIGKTTQKAGWRCLQSDSTTESWSDAALVINGRVAPPFKMHPTALLPRWRSGNRRCLGPLRSTDRHLPKSPRGRNSKAVRGEPRRDGPAERFLFLLSIRKCEKDIRIEPLKYQLLSAFSPGGCEMQRKREACCVAGRGGVVSLQELFEKWLLVSWASKWH